MGDLLKARKKLCFTIAEKIVDHVNGKGVLSHRPWDIESITQVIELYLPLTYAEADEAYDEAPAIKDEL
jgi:hypothetical protein